MSGKLFGIMVLIWCMVPKGTAQCPIPSVLSSSATCGQGATLTASGSTGIFRWYNQASGGTLLGTGASYTTPALYSNQTFYVEAVDNLSNPNCISPRAAAIVQSNPLPSPITIGDSVMCGTQGTLLASGSSGSFNWFTQPTGGTPVFQGSSYNVQLTQTTTFYVEATDNLNPTQTVTFNYTGGQQTWTVPAGVFSISVDVQGAQGGNNTNYGNRGGFGGQVLADLAVTPGQTVYIRAGGWPNTSTSGGYNGGANSNVSSSFGQGGGGASDIRLGGTGTNNRVIVAGGGGGGGWNCGTDGSRGGDGGGLTGEAGYYCNSTNNTTWTGRGGSQNSGGNAGSNWCCPSNGSLANGGGGGYRGGGGGGGYYGGGGSSYGGGGGGSSYTDPQVATNVTHNQGVRTGHGTVSITYTSPFCLSARIPVTYQAGPVSNPSAQAINANCGDTIQLSATGSTGFFEWFDAPTAGNSLGINANLTQNFVTNSDTFYVEAITDPNPSGTLTFNYTGGVQNWTVPAGVFSVSFDVAGAQGGSNQWSQGGNGGRITGDLAVTPGQLLRIYVGQQPTSQTGGWNGGGNGWDTWGRGGGGGSDIRIGGTSLADRVVAAGAGGGAGYACGTNSEPGGAGGGNGTAEGGRRCGSTSTCFSGSGGSQNAGGLGATCSNSQSGSFGNGGNASTSCCSDPGGGGGGYYGGGGGYDGGSGGGGSSWADPNLASNISHTQGDRSGHGQVTISFVKAYCSSSRIPVPISVTPLSAPITQGDSATCGTPVTLTASGSTTPIAWYDAPTGGNILAFGPQLSLPPVLASDTFFVGTETSITLSGSQTFNFTGSPQTWTVPAGVSQIQIDASGAQGGTNSWNQGGLGGRVQTSLNVTPGDVLHVYVGEQSVSNTGGWNGGGGLSSSTTETRGGGGASDVRLNGTALADRVVVAGGGGGAGRQSSSSGYNGGDGGGLTGAPGLNANSPNTTYVGSGGSQTAGGAGSPQASPGALGQGGNAYYYNTSYFGGGGGGGYYGGGGGRGACCWHGGGGGGGSNFADPNLTTATTHTQGFQSGNGQISISYNVNLVCASPRVPAEVWLDSLQAPVASGDTTFCGSGSASLSVTGPQGNYVWYDTLGGNIANVGQNWTTPTLSNPITYYVNYTVNGCPSKYDTVQVLATPFPEINLGALASTNLCSGNAPLDLGFAPSLLSDSIVLTNCGATGANGPTQQDADNTYGSGTILVNGGIQEWVVPFTGIYTIEAFGASGGTVPRNQPGLGAHVKGDFQLTAGQTIHILVGQEGTSSNATFDGGGGGGGTFIWDANNTAQPMLVAGGGAGGGNNTQSSASKHASATSNGQDNGGAVGGGTNGNGGNAGHTGSWGGGGGAGWLTNGASDGNYGKGGTNPLAGGIGGPGTGSSNNSGGFGGGGSDGYDGGGGGGGYSGGAGGGFSGQNFRNGGGGGSFNTGTNQANLGGVHAGHGLVKINYFISQPSDTTGTWSGPGITDTIAGIFTPSQAQVGSNTVYYTVSSNGCVSQDSLQIMVQAGPDASITSAPSTYCDYSATDTLAALNNGGLWSGNGVIDANQGIFDPTAVAPGTYQVYHTINDTVAGCSVTDSVQVVVNPTPDASVANPGTVCSADQAFNLAPATPGGTWSGNGITNTSNGTFTPNANLIGNNTVVYSVTQNGCINTDSLVVPVVASPNPTISNAPMQVCADASALLLSAVTSGGTWTGAGMANSNSGLFDPQLAGTGTAQVIYQVTASNNCSAADTVSIVVNPLPQVAVSPNAIQSICAGGNVSLNASGATNYQWFNNGNPISGANQPSLSATNAGAYTVVGTDANGCANQTAAVQVNVQPNPIISQILANDDCQGAQVDFTQNSTIGQGGVITNYTWDFGNGNSGNGFQASETYANPGNYTVQLVVSTPDGCADTATANLVIHPNPTVDSVNVTNACFPTPANFAAFVSGANVSSYSWDFGNGATGNGQSVVHGYSSPGIYYYSLNTVSDQGCVAAFNGNVIVDEQPVADFLNVPACVGQPVIFTDLSSGNITDWDWNFSTGTDTAQNPTYTFTQAGTYPVNLSVTTAAGCTNSTSALVQVNQTPDANFTDLNVGVNQVQFAPTAPLVTGTYLWTFGDGTTSNQVSPLKQYQIAGTYQVCLTIDNGDCSTTECQNIEARDITSFEDPNAQALDLMLYPNPFESAVYLSMNLPEEATVQATLRDIAGRAIASIDFGQLSSGTHQLPVETANLNLATGVYVMDVTINDEVFTTRIVKK